MLHIEVAPGARGRHQPSSSSPIRPFGRIGPEHARLAERRLAGDRRGGLVAHLEARQIGALAAALRRIRRPATGRRSVERHVSEQVACDRAIWRRIADLLPGRRHQLGQRMPASATATSASPDRCARVRTRPGAMARSPSRCSKAAIGRGTPGRRPLVDHPRRRPLDGRRRRPNCGGCQGRTRIASSTRARPDDIQVGRAEGAPRSGRAVGRGCSAPANHSQASDAAVARSASPQPLPMESE